MEVQAVDRTELLFDVEDKERTPEEKVWVAVLAQTIRDALSLTNISNAPAHYRAVETAQRYLLEPSPAYWRICELSNVNARELREIVVPMVLRHRQTGWQPECIASKCKKPRQLAYTCTAGNDRAPAGAPLSLARSAASGH